METTNIKNHSGNKYLRTIISPIDGQSIKTDVYGVLEAYNVTCSATAHACKKLLCAGLRGKGDKLQDLKEAIDAIMRAIELEKGRTPSEPATEQIYKFPQFKVIWCMPNHQNLTNGKEYLVLYEINDNFVFDDDIGIRRMQSKYNFKQERIPLESPKQECKPHFKVKCLNNQWIENTQIGLQNPSCVEHLLALTFGKVYTVEKEDYGAFYIKNDIGQYGYYAPNRFEKC